MKGDSSRKKNTLGDTVDKYPELMGLLGSIGAFGLGVALLFDDAKDLGLFSTPDHPSPLHHWQISIPIMLGGLTGICGFGARLLQRIKEKNNI